MPAYSCLSRPKTCPVIWRRQEGIFDKAYVDFPHLADLDRRDVFWVTRAKGDIPGDVLIELETPKIRKAYPQQLRLVTAYVKINGVKKPMTFITNNLSWAASSICDLSKCRWGVEVFFKQIKQAASRVITTKTSPLWTGVGRMNIDSSPVLESVLSSHQPAVAKRR